MKKIIMVLSFVVLLSGCAGKGSDNDVKQKQLEAILNENNYMIVDVRTKEEYDTGHVVDSINIPYQQIGESSFIDKNKTIIVYCQSGMRSHAAFQTLKSLGYDVFDLGAYDTISLEKE